MQGILELSCVAQCVCTVYSAHLIFALVVPGRQTRARCEGLCFTCVRCLCRSPHVLALYSRFSRKNATSFIVHKRESFLWSTL